MMCANRITSPLLFLFLMNDDLDSASVAVTGLVLVREHYGIASAEDVVKIPHDILVESSEAMFFPRDDKVQYRRLRGYLTPPGTPAGTLALLHLHPADPPIPILPVCQLKVHLSASNELYILGLTDDNGPLEKFVYKMEFMDSEKCKSFYDLVELTDDKLVPADTKCAAARNLHHSCVWDTGTALVTNVTGTWALLGVGVGGPGCAVAARFISLAHYWPWIQENTKPHLMDTFRKKGVVQPRRRDGEEGLSADLTHPARDPLMHAEYLSPHEAPPTPEPHDVPLHAVLRTLPGFVLAHQSHNYHLAPPEADMFHVDRASALEINVQRGEGHVGNCTDKGLDLVYKDYVNISADATSSGSVQYKISLYDLMFLNYTCVTVRAYPEAPEHAFLQYTIGMHDGGDLFRFTPEDIIKHNPMENPYGPKDPHAKMSKFVVTGPVNDDTVHSMMLYVEVLFTRTAVLEVRVYGQVTAAAGELWQQPSVTMERDTTPSTFIINPKDGKRKR